MSKKMLIDATHPEETRVVVVDGTKVEDFDFESVNKRQLAGNIYLAKVTRVEPSLQAAFVEYGGNRHGFLAFAEIHPDYYQIPKADREALLAAEEAANRAADEEEERPARAKARPARKRPARRGDRPASGDAAPAAVGATPDDGGAEDAQPETAAAGEPVADMGEGAASEPEAPARLADETEVPPSTDGGAEGGDELPRAMAESSGADGSDRVSEDYPAPEAPAAAPAEAAPAEPPAAESGSEIVAEGSPETAGTPAEGDATSESAERPGRRPRRPRARRKAVSRSDEAESVAETVAAPETAPVSREADVAESRRADDEARSAEPAEEAPESVGAESVEDEVRPRRPQLRRYKIQEVIKVRQIMLVQVVKEERGNKGAALTTYLSLAGRYCVLMPNTARGGGISRKITSAEDRKKLKEIASEFEVPKGMGLIIRTAGAQRTRAEIKRDYEYLLRQWDQIRELTLKSIAPALIYEEGSLIKRSIRDIYSKEIEEILVAGEDGYREAKDYMRMLMPSHAKFVQPYREAIPLFSRYQVESYLAAMFNPTVQLRSGGYIVIGVTEALVAIDVNSGRSTREGSIEETALKTNLEAADEVARQLRLRDLAGLIVIDFIDMDERKNNAAVEKRMKERLKSDRARIQMGRISAFGLMELSRQRLRPGMLEASTAPCPHCHGTGLIRSADSLALSILREIEEEGVRARAREIKVVAPVQIANFLVNQKREHILAVESRYGLSVLIEGDAALVSPEHRIERMKSPTRALPPPDATVRAETAFAALEDPRDALDEEEDGEEDAPVAEAAPARRPPEGRPDRRPEGRSDGNGEAREPRESRPQADRPGEDADRDGKSRRRRGKRGGKKRRRTDEEIAAQAASGGADPMPVLGEDGEPEAPMRVSRSAFGDEIEAQATALSPETESAAIMGVGETTAIAAMAVEIEQMVGEAAPETKAARFDPEPSTTDEWRNALPAPEAPPVAVEPAAEPAREAAPSPAAADEPSPATDAAPRPRRTGWWLSGLRS